MWKKFATSILLLIFVKFRFIESYVEFVEVNKLPKKGTLDGLGTMQTIQLLSYNRHNAIGNQIHSNLHTLRNEKRKRWHFEELNNRIRRSLELQGNINRNARQNDNDLNKSNNKDDEPFLETEMLQAPKLNTSSNSDSASSFETMTSSGNSSYLPPPTGNPWKPEVSSYYPQQSAANSYYPHQSTCVCQPVYHRPPPPPYSYYQPPELVADAYIGYAYGPPAQGQHLPIFKPFPFSFEHGIYSGSTYFKPSRPDEYHGSYEAPKHSFIPTHKNFFKK